MSSQKENFVEEVHKSLTCLIKLEDGIELEMPNNKLIPWPGEEQQYWPKADICGFLKSSGKFFIIEIDDQADPGRSVVKYWPLLHAMSEESFKHEPILFLEISSRNGTLGDGYQKLAQFIGERFEELFKDKGVFEYEYMLLDRSKSAEKVAEDILEFLKRKNVCDR